MKTTSSDGGGPSLKEKIDAAVQKIMETASIECGVDFYANVKITDDGELKELNKAFRGVDASTDVLSFPNYELDGLLVDCLGDIADVEMEDGLIFIGDVAISLETAKRQSVELGHSLVRETAFLALHGVLHLLGYDHEDAADEEVMTAMQRQVIEKAGDIG